MVKINRNTKKAEEIGNLANMHVQSRKGPLVEGAYASFHNSWGFIHQKQSYPKRELPSQEQREEQGLRKQPKPVPIPVRMSSRSVITCYKCVKPGYMFFLNCGKGSNRSAQGYFLCMTPLIWEHLQFPPCNTLSKIEGKPGEMVADSGCTRTLVHERFVKNGFLTVDKISVLTATVERLIVLLAWVETESGQGKHAELLGVLDKLPVDCLLGRSSFGQTLSRENVLEQWEKNVSGHNSNSNEAFVSTRRQKTLKDAQKRADALIDRKNSLVVKSLSKKPLKENGLEQGGLRILFGDKELEENEKKKSLKNHMVVAVGKNELTLNILDRNRNQLTEDQMSDVTLDTVRSGASEKASQEIDSYFIQNGILKRRKFLEAENNGTRYVDRIVVLELHRNEILRVGHTVPLCGHMGKEKTLDGIAAHFVLARFIARCAEILCYMPSWHFCHGPRV